MPRPEWVRSPEYLASLRSQWLHQHAIGVAQVLMLLTIMVAKFLWKRPEGGNVFWDCANWVVIGQWILSAEDLPILPIPKQAVVTNDFIEFDGWVFPLSYVTKGLLEWLQASLLRWVKEDDSKRNKEWINGIVEAFQDAVADKL